MKLWKNTGIIITLVLAIFAWEVGMSETRLFQPKPLDGMKEVPASKDSEKLDARQFPVQPYSQEEIETRARISLPKDIIGLESYVETGGMDDLIALRFSVSPLALYGTISRAGYVMPLERLDYVGSAFPMIGNKIPEWPTKEKWDAMLNDKSVILMGAHQPEAGFSRNIIVDETDPNMYTVYLVHWEL